jgi:glycogen(starch) synthase
VRLLVITDLYPPIAFGGYERTCAELVDGLRERHEVTVLTSDLRRNAAPELAWVRRDLPHLGL